MRGVYKTEDVMQDHEDRIAVLEAKAEQWESLVRRVEALEKRVGELEKTRVTSMRFTATQEDE